MSRLHHKKFYQLSNASSHITIYTFCIRVEKRFESLCTRHIHIIFFKNIYQRKTNFSDVDTYHDQKSSSFCRVVALRVHVHATASWVHIVVDLWQTRDEGIPWLHACDEVQHHWRRTTNVMATPAGRPASSVDLYSSRDRRDSVKLDYRIFHFVLSLAYIYAHVHVVKDLKLFIFEFWKFTR